MGAAEVAEAAAIVVARAATVPLGVGEGLSVRPGFRDAIEKQLADFVQPVLGQVGGIWGARKVAVLAETYYVGFGLHHCGGPVALAMGLQVAACTPNFTMMELPYGLLSGFDKIPEIGLEIRNGHLRVPSRPGLGIEHGAVKTGLVIRD